MRSTTRTWLTIGIMTLALSAAGCGDKGGGSGGGVDGADSPEALVEMARPLAESNDMGALIGVIAPDDRPVMAFMGLFMAQMMPQMAKMAAQFNPDEDAKKEAEAKYEGMQKGIDALMAEHGVDPSKLEGGEAQALMQGGEPNPEKVRAFMQANFPDLKPGPFLSGISAVMREFGDEKQAEMMSKGFKGELEDLEIDGDRATGSVDGDKMVFVRVNGRWYVSLTESMKEQ